jgi:hypothetical protein
MPDLVGRDAERDDPRYRPDRLVSVTPCQLPTPPLTSQAARNRHVAGLVRGQERRERVRPAEGSIHTRLVRGHQHSQDGFIVSTDMEVLDSRLAVCPPEHRNGRPIRFRGQIHPYQTHQHRLRCSS